MNHPAARSSQRQRSAPGRALAQLGLVAKAAVVVLAAAAAGCGGASRRAHATASPGPGPAIDPAWLTGRWRWTFASSAGGTRRVEIEQWDLSAEGATVTGSCRREVVLLSEDTQPFRCSQSLSYRLRTDYQLRGRLGPAGGGVVDEVSFEVAPSPCEAGHRGLARYQLARRGADLILTWPGGRETLSRADRAAPALPPVAPSGDPEAPAPPLTGAWHWQNRTASPRGEVRVERESWTLDEGPGGRLDGSYQRWVTFFTEDGRIYPCNGQSSYDYTDRYRLRGWRHGDDVTVSEVAVTASNSACAGGARRSLDSAVGTVYPEALELTWRGKNLQVLERDPSARPQRPGR